MNEQQYSKLYDLLREEGRIEYYSLEASKNKVALYEHFLTENSIIQTNKVIEARKWRAKKTIEAVRYYFMKEIADLAHQRLVKHEKKARLEELEERAFMCQSALKNLENLSNSIVVSFLDPHEASWVFFYMSTLATLTPEKVQTYNDVVFSLAIEEIWFWAWKYRQIGRPAVNAFKVMYRDKAEI